MDLKIDLKGSQEDENKWSSELVFMRQLSTETQKMTTSFEILKPSKRIDFKVAFDGFKKADIELNATASLRYAQGMAYFRTKELWLNCNISSDKEMSASIYRKRHKLYQEGWAQIKLPSFNPMTVNGTVYEKTQGEYEASLIKRELKNRK